MKSVNKFLIFALLVAGGFMASIRISAAGIDEIKRSEALRLKPYLDSAGKWTIGWGHLIKSDEKYLLDKNGITSEKADKLLRADLSNAERIVNTLVTVPITGNQYDALVSFVFNIGEGNFSKSTLLRVLNAGDYNAAAEQFPRWAYAGGQQSAGLLARRAREQTTFLS